MMRPSRIGLAVALGLGLFASSAKAQDGGFSDPFFLYYGFYLPRQAALAAQGQPEDRIREYSAQRQYAAQTDRAGLYAPLNELGGAELDPLNPFGTRSGSSRLARTTAVGLPAANIGGRGLSGYHNSTGSFYPTLRSGGGAARSRPRSRSVVPQRSGGGMGRMGGMGGGMGGGMR